MAYEQLSFAKNFADLKRRWF